MRTLHELRLIQLEERKKAEKKSLNKLAPEMLEMLKKLNKYAPNTCRDLNVESLIAKAQGGK
jgi:hypothetical protein